MSPSVCEEALEKMGKPAKARVALCQESICIYIHVLVLYISAAEYFSKKGK